MRAEAVDTFWHVTTAAAAVILAEGFEGSWGDVGFGVYLFSDLSAARIYRAAGGWDGQLEDPIILEITAVAGAAEPVTPETSWSNPEDYRHVCFVQMDEDQEDDRWFPAIRTLEEDAPEPG